MTTILVGFGIFSLNFAAPVSAASSLTLTIPNDVLSLDLTLGDTIASKESDAKTVSVSTTAPFGYTLSIKSGDSSASALKNGSSLLASITTAMSFADFQSKAPNNSWGFKPSMKDSNANSNYQPAPTSSGMTIEKTSAANSSAKDYNFSIATKIDPTAAVGVYKNTFTLTAVINTVSYNITYNLNSGTWSGTSPQTGSTAESSITLDSHAPTRSNYSFQGWCTVSPTNNSTTNPSCSGQTYTTGQSYALANGSNTVNLYAMWKQTVTYRSYTINYRSNVGSPSNMPTTQTGSAASTNNYSVTLRSNTPTLSGYTFQGWCTSSTSDTSCSGSSYSAGGSITITSNNQTINLYAKWKSNYGASCQGGSGIILKDGKCWFTIDATYQYRQVAYAGALSVCNGSPWRIPTVDDACSLLKSYYPTSVQYQTPGCYAPIDAAFLNDWDPQTSMRSWWVVYNEKINNILSL